MDSVLNHIRCIETVLEECLAKGTSVPASEVGNLSAFARLASVHGHIYAQILKLHVPPETINAEFGRLLHEHEIERGLIPVGTPYIPIAEKREAALERMRERAKRAERGENVVEFDPLKKK